MWKMKLFIKWKNDVILSFHFLLSNRQKNGKINALYLSARVKPPNDELHRDVRVGINNKSNIQQQEASDEVRGLKRKSWSD